MRDLRRRSLGALLVVAVVAILLPVTSQAQFGGLIKRAHALRARLDSAKVMVDSSKAVVRSSQATVSDATNGSLAPDTSGGASGAGKGGAGKGGANAKASGDKAVTGGPSTATGTAAAGASTRGRVARNASGRRTATASSASPHPAGAALTRSATTSAGVTRTRVTGTGVHPAVVITESVYEQVAHGIAVQNAYLQTNPHDVVGALNAAAPVSGLNTQNYSYVRARILLYNSYAKANAQKLAAPLFTAQELAVLNAHAAEIAQMFQP